MARFPHPVAATELRAGMQTFKATEHPVTGRVKLQPDVKLHERFIDTPGFVHARWNHLSWKTATGNLVVYPPCAKVWVA